MHYTSWRTLQLLLGVMGCVLFVVLYKFLPETSHPGERGIDKLKAKEDSGPGSASSFRQYLPVFLNPLAPLGLMRYPNLLLVVRQWNRLFCPCTLTSFAMHIVSRMSLHPPDRLWSASPTSPTAVSHSPLFPCSAPDSNLLYNCTCGTSTTAMSTLTLAQGKRYDISNEMIIGACFLPAGLGNMCAYFHKFRLAIHKFDTHSQWEHRLLGGFQIALSLA